MAHVLVTGATGYIGGRLIPRLIEQGHAVRALARDPERLAGRPWSGQVEIVQGDLLLSDGLDAACEGIDAAYYLVHSMGAKGDFQARDRQAATNFVQAATGVPLVIYLGGLLPPDAASKHLSSRAEVGRILDEALPLTEFRAGPIIGSGSASFEMVRYLTERLPVMVTPSWIKNPVQPIGVSDVLSYLVAALDRPPLGVVDIGADLMTFKSMMAGYAEARGLKRRMFATPVLAPGLAARWVQFVTPIPNSLAVPLIRGIVEPVRADTTKAEAEFPDIRPVPFQEAVERAIGRVEALDVETRWSGAQTHDAYHVEDWENVVRETCRVTTEAPPALLWERLERLGGSEGWPAWQWAWRLRGAVDLLLGGPGLRRGRRHPGRLYVGEALDWWRVEAIEPGRMLRLRAEMKLPGKAWLQFEVDDGPPTALTVTALFEPRGFPGAAYWKALVPVHRRLFPDLARAIVRDAEKASVAPVGEAP